MAYIVFDMEWNQPACADQPQRGANGVRLSGEIMQIGAVRLAPDGSVADSFSMCVHPRFYKRLNRRVRELTGITKEMLADAPDFPEVCAAFATFCGEHPILLTWGYDDIPMLKQNMTAWGLDTSLCADFYNLQTVFNAQTDGGKGQRSLAYAMEYYGIAPEFEAHDALHDAYHTALVAAHLDLGAGLSDYGGDPGTLWEHPVENGRFGPYKSKRDAFADTELTLPRCPTCGAVLQTEKWVAKGGGSYITVAHCDTDGAFVGRMHFRMPDKTTVYALRTLYKGTDHADEHYGAAAEKAEARKTAFKERMRERKKQKAAERAAAREAAKQADAEKAADVAPAEVAVTAAAPVAPENRFAMSTEEARARMESGRIYYPSDPSIMDEQAGYLETVYDYNATRPGETEKRAALLREMFAEIGENAYIEPPFHANFGGRHVHIGRDFYANFNLTLVDDADIRIGDGCMCAPNVVIATAAHPIDPEMRRAALQYNLPVTIGNNVWLGAGAIVLPGVTIGDNTVVGAGAVVTKNLPANVVAVGNPARVLREIGEHDKIYYHKDLKVDL